MIIPARSTEFSFHETASVPRTGKTLPPHDGKAVRSRIPDPAWNESASKHRYLELPRGKISSRVRQLAASIVKNVHTSYGRALALRDYLRKNYPYKLNAAPVPPGKEPADYFLFELKEGHCEYFACALAVLARSAGLPSRVATGFSPGNYNTLSNLFEVYEYHAHAWTQIYIEQMGWLTMDATPPSSVPSRSLPAGLGQLRDPFDDEWRITPPELTKKTQDLLKNDWLEKLGSRKDELSKIDSALVKVAEAQEKIQDEVREKYRGTMKRIRKSRETGLIFQMKAIWNKTVSFFGNLLSAFYDFIFSAGLLLLAVLLLAAAGFNFFRILSASRRYRRTVFRMERLRSEAESLWEKDPRRAVLSIYTALRLSLKLAGFERGTLELLDFADRLAEADPRLSESARELFLLYYQAEYGFRDLTSQAARRAIALYDSVQDPNRSAD